MFGKLANLLKNAEQIKSKVKAVRENLKNRTVEGEAGGGAVRVVASCDKQISSINLNPNAIAQPLQKEALESLIVEASNEALKKAEVIQKEEAKKAMDEFGLDLPGLF